VSSESIPVPEGQPVTVRRPRSSGNGLVTMGPSGAPTMMILPAEARPSRVHSRALALVSVERMMLAPPRALWLAPAWWSRCR
jgi:hypothetical protein